MVGGIQEKREKGSSSRLSLFPLVITIDLWLTLVAAPTVEAPSRIFGVELQTSIKYANVAISLMDENGESFIYGYVPIVVAKCGVYLKEKGEVANSRCIWPRYTHIV